MAQPLWRPSGERIRASNLARFMAGVEERWEVEIGDYAALYRFSIADMEKFWRSVADFTGIIAERWGETVLADADKMPGARWFPDARLNFAENLLPRNDDADAIVFRGEGEVRRRLSWAELTGEVSKLSQAFRAMGVGPGDRVAAFMPNMPETIIAALASATVGAVFSSCSPDFGPDGVLDRFGQIEPKVLFSADGYFFNGKTYDSLPRLAEIAARLPSVEKTVVVPYVGAQPSLAGIAGGVAWRDFIGTFTAGEIAFARLPFDHPLYILYTSGTTGEPKCIVHGAGGTLLQHAKEHALMCDIKPGDRVFYATTTGWMMWNWLVSVLARGATVMLYDGSPFYPGPEVLFDYAEAEAFTLFGTSAKFIDAVNKTGLAPAKGRDFADLRTMTSTGSPLAPESFDFVYAKIKQDLHLASVSGGTDIVGCFVGGDPTGPVWRGEIQARCLGMAVEVFDDDGRPLSGVKGELVCTAPFPSMPVSFWNDADGAKYRAAYFERYAGVWHHGDFIELTEHGGVIIHGRSDATLNPGGVRIGTAEIYRQVERLDEVVEAIAIGQQWQGDVRIVLFVVMRQGLELSEALTERIKARVRANCSPRHVPARVVQVADIPRTKSGKITELAVADVVHGREVKYIGALANPEALELYRDLEALRT
ncbi:MAG: acetoacetate--CoA ligase [Proteobacteria bacterium]|nr:acetoacetate--CoA ligase [Pseudomonadota bacterium]